MNVIRDELIGNERGRGFRYGRYVDRKYMMRQLREDTWMKLKIVHSFLRCQESVR